MNKFLYNGFLLFLFILISITGCTTNQFIPREIKGSPLTALAELNLKNTRKVIIDGVEAYGDKVYLSPGKHYIEYEKNISYELMKELQQSMEVKGYKTGIDIYGDVFFYKKNYVNIGDTEFNKVVHPANQSKLGWEKIKINIILEAGDSDYLYIH